MAAMKPDTNHKKTGKKPSKRPVVHSALFRVRLPKPLHARLIAHAEAQMVPAAQIARAAIVAALAQPENAA